MTGLEFGRALRELRKRHRKSQLRLALAAGTNQRYISELETGVKNGPTEQIIFRLGIAMHAGLWEVDLLRITRGFRPLAPDWQDLSESDILGLLEDLEKGNLG
jgi:transcriptional regulator with XRE-family HTH domain